MADRSPQALVSPDRPVQQCREICVRQLNAAVQELARRKPNIHGARKQLKRARATLRLLRPAIGDEAYRQENIAARDAARPLSQARDEDVLGQAHEGLIERFGPAASGIQIRKNARKLTPRQLDAIKAALERSRTRLRARALDHADWDCIEQGVRSTYRRARHALRRARGDRATEQLHEWRKQTKYLWHQLQLLTPLASGPIGELADDFHRLADYLGDEHDLAVLREQASTPVKALIDRRREELQDKAFALGARLFADGAATFARALRKQWTKWEHKEAPRHLTATSAP
jgi:CHAD domain-containing protein